MGLQDQETEHLKKCFKLSNIIILLGFLFFQLLFVFGDHVV